MGRLLVAVLAAAWAVAGWRNMPRLPDPQAGAVGLSIGVCLLLAYFAGRSTSRRSAMAAAMASADARAAAVSTAAATSQVVVNVGDGLAARSAAAFGGLDSAPWIASTSTTPALPDDVVHQALEDAVGDLEHDDHRTASAGY